MARKPRQREPTPDPPQDEILLEPANAIDPYVILSIDKNATQDQVKSAYRKAALKHHPDKAQPDEKDIANTKFQEIATAYAILSDEKRRRRYDLTGNTSESLDDDDFDWTEFFRAQSEAVINGDMIAQIQKEYQGTEEERQDVLRAYEEGEGDMDMVYETVMCSNVLDDDERFRKYIHEAITNGEVEKYAKYLDEGKDKKSKRVKRAKAEEQEALELAEELGVREKLFTKKDKRAKNSKGAGTDEDGLKALIRQRQKDRSESFFDQLEAKYAGGKRRKGRTEDEPPEEAFQRNAKKAKGQK